MALTKNRPVEEPVSTEPAEKPVVEKQPEVKKREADKMIVLEHPTVKGSANVGMYFQDSEISFSIKEGKYSLENKKENYSMRDALIKDGWIDHTYYGHFHHEKPVIQSVKQIIEWTFKHPLASENYPMNGTVGVMVQDSEFTLEIKDSLIILKESDFKNAKYIAERLEKDGFNLIDFKKEK